MVSVCLVSGFFFFCHFYLIFCSPSSSLLPIFQLDYLFFFYQFGFLKQSLVCFKWYLLKTSFSDYLLWVYRNTVDFYILTLYPVPLLTSLANPSKSDG